MAEIPIQEKRGGSKLPLILVGLALLALLAWMLTRNNDEGTAVTGDTAAVVAPLPPTTGDTLTTPATGTGTDTATGTATGTGTGTTTRP